MSTTYIIDRVNDSAVRFKGERIAHVSSFEGIRAQETGRWTELSAYKTDTGRYVLVITGKSNHKNEVDLNRVFVENRVEDLKRHLFPNMLSKSLFRDLGIEDVDDID